MKRNFKRILSFLLVACTMLTLLPTFSIISSAQGDTVIAKDYDDAADGELLYTVNFNMNDGIFSKHLVDTNVKYDVSDTDAGEGAKLTFSEKSAAASYVGGKIEKYRITGCVYTVSFYLEIPTPSTNRAGIALVHDGLSRNGLNTQKNTTGMSILVDGTNTIISEKSIARKIDDNRQYFKVVVDGIGMTVKFYTLNSSGIYEDVGLQSTIKYQNESFYNYLFVGLFTYDALTDGNHVALGDVSITKGNEFSTGTKTEYQNQYDATEVYGTLIDVNFNDIQNAANGWTTLRGAQADYITISDEGKALTLNKSDEGGAVQYGLCAFLPNHTELLNYGSLTYEMYVESNKRTGAFIFGGRTGSTAFSLMGFSYNNGTTANMFLRSHSWIQTSGDAFTTSNPLYKNFRCTPTVYNQVQNPYTGADITCNVKIEVDTVAQTATQFILQEDGTFIKTAELYYGGTSLYPILSFYAYDQNTNAKFSNVVIKKGLTETKEETKLVEFKVDDGRVTFPEIVTESTVLPTPTEKHYYSASYQLTDGKPVSTVADLSLKPGYNTVELQTVYTAEPITTGYIELRGIQHGITSTGASVRLIGVVNSTEFSEVGFRVTAVYRDSDGNVHTGTKTVDLSTTVLHDTVIANTDSGCEEVHAEALGGKYLVALAITSVPTGENVQVDFTVTPYTVKDGVTVDGETMTLSFINGVYTQEATPLS